MTLGAALSLSASLAPAQPTPSPFPPPPAQLPPGVPPSAPPQPSAAPAQPGPPGTIPVNPNGQPQPPPNPGYAPPPGYGPNPGYAPNQGYGPNPGYAPNQGYGPPPGYQPSPPVKVPTQFDYIEGAEIPPGFKLDTQPRAGLAIGGFSMFAATYLPTIITAGFVIDNERSASAGPLFVPGIGPFFAIGTLQTGAGAGVLLVLDGLAQSAGLAMGIAAFASPRKVIVRSQYGSVHFAPIATGGAIPGFGLAGDF